MGLFNGLTKEEDKIVDWLVRLLEESYVAVNNTINKKKENFFKSIFTRKLSTTTWLPNSVREAALNSLKQDIDYLTKEKLIYTDEQKVIILKALNDEYEEMKSYPEDFMVELAQNWYSVNSYVIHKYVSVTGHGVKYYKNKFRNYFKKGKDN